MRSGDQRRAGGSDRRIAARVIRGVVSAPSTRRSSAPIRPRRQ
jgi:hypothetical protein